MEIKSFVIGLSCGLSVSVAVASVVTGTSTGAAPCGVKVERINGLDIYVDAVPLCDYEVIGSVETGFFYLKHDGYPTVRNHLIHKAVRQFKNADALIFNWEQRGSVGAAQVIRFR